MLDKFRLKFLAQDIHRAYMHPRGWTPAQVERNVLRFNMVQCQIYAHSRIHSQLRFAC